MKKHSNNIVAKIIFLFLVFSIVVSSIPLYAAIHDDLQEKYVFKIISEECSLCPSNTGNNKKSLTGFTVQGTSGIITALHGVVGQQSITAMNSQNNESFGDLKIIQVDIEHDIALLSSPKLHGKTGGFNTPLIGEQPDCTKIQSIGYPLNVPEQRPIPIVQLNAHLPYRKLWTLLPEGSLRTDIQKRKSPSYEEDVLHIEGQFLPGYSGAPVLNEKSQVVGVANGGLQIGSSISWAIPYDKINLKPISSKEEGELARLSHLTPPALFSFTTVFQASSGALLQWQEPRDGKMMTWDEANDYVEEKNREGLLGYHDWRLPAIGELQDLAKFIKDSPGSYSDTDKLYWSSEYRGSSLWESEVLHAFAVNLGDVGERGVKFRKSKRLAVRLVRNI